MRNEGEREGGNAVGSNSYLIVAECFDLRGNERTKRDLRAIRGEEGPATEQRERRPASQRGQGMGLRHFIM